MRSFFGKIVHCICWASCKIMCAFSFAIPFLRNHHCPMVWNIFWRSIIVSWISAHFSWEWDQCKVKICWDWATSTVPWIRMSFQKEFWTVVSILKPKRFYLGSPHLDVLKALKAKEIIFLKNYMALTESCLSKYH